MLNYEFFIIISVLIYIFIFLIFIWKKFNIKKLIISSLFYFYIITVISVTIFPIPIQWLNEVWKYGWKNNFIPFLSIFDILFNSSLAFIIKQIIGNIFLFIPMGFLVPLIWKSKRVLKKALFVGVILSFSIELLQYIIFYYRVTDIDDILLNTLGFVIGFYLYRLYGKYVNT